MGVQWEELVGKFLVHSLYFLVIDNSLPTTSSQARLSYQTCIKLSSRDVSLNHTGTLLKVFSKNYKRTSKTFARIRTAKKKKKNHSGKPGSVTLGKLNCQTKPCQLQDSIYVGLGRFPFLPRDWDTYLLLI